MAYQPPGPYPIMPMQPVYGAPAQRPPIPKAALRSYYSILVGAGLSAVGLIATFFDFGSLRSQFEADYPQYSSSHIGDLINVALGAVIVAGLIQLSLWAWMAWKIRTGRHWARVLSTVFFGISVVDQAVGNTSFYANLGGSGQEQHSITTPHPLVTLIIGWATVLAGLSAVVLFWQKSNAPFFRPQQFFGPVGYPYPYPYPPQGGYPTGPYPQVPGQGTFVPPEGQPQPPADPWSTPPK